MQELTDKATPGQWRYILGNGIGLRGSSFELVQDEGLSEANGEFIAAARSLVPALVRELREAREQLATAERALKIELGIEAAEIAEYCCANRDRDYSKPVVLCQLPVGHSGDCVWSKDELASDVLSLRGQVRSARRVALTEAADAYLVERGCRYMPPQVASWLRARAGQQ